MKRTLIADLRLVLSLAATAIFSGCSGEVRDGVDMKNKVAFGAALPLSGAYRTLGSDCYRGMQVAAAALNATGGVNGEMVHVQVYDSAGEREKAFDGVLKLTREFEAPFIAVALPGPAEHCADEIARAENCVGLPLESGPRSHAFTAEKFLRLSVSGNAEADLLAETLLKENRTRPLILACPDPYGAETAETLAEKLARAGIRATRMELRPDTEAMRDLDAALKGAARPDAVCLIGHGPEIAPALLRLTRAGIPGDRVLGNHAFGGHSVTLLDRALLRGVRYTATGFHSRPDAPATRRFIEEYRSLNLAEPDLFAALGYDQVMIPFTAVKGADEKNPAQARARLISRSTVEGAAGVYKFDANGEAALALALEPVPAK